MAAAPTERRDRRRARRAWPRRGKELTMVPGRRVLVVLFFVAIGALYESLVWFRWGAMMPRFPTPYAVPIFDVPFVLVAVGIGYLCLERSEEHTSELQSPCNLVCRLLLEKKKKLQCIPS